MNTECTHTTTDTIRNCEPKKYTIAGHEVKFYYNDGCTIAKIGNAKNYETRYDVVNFINKKLKLNDPADFSFESSATIWKNLRMPDDICAKAYCHQNDEYDVCKGQSIAYHRLRKKYCKMFVKRLYAFEEWISRCQDMLFNETLKYENIITKIEDYEDKIFTAERDDDDDTEE